MSHMDESWHIWESHFSCHIRMYRVIHGSVRIHNESYHIWMSHVTHGWVMAHMSESFLMSHMNVPCHPWRCKGRQWDNVAVLRVPGVNESCHICMSHVTYKWVMSHMNESCQIWKGSYHTWMGHVTYEWVMARTNGSYHIWVRANVAVFRASDLD